MTKFRSAVGKVLAAIGVAGLAVAGAAGVAVAAQPAPGTPPGGAAAGATGTLTVHKHVGSTTEDPNNGTAQTVARPPLAGVQFTVCRVAGIDLSTNAGWEAAKTKTPENSVCMAGTSTALVTNASGQAEFGGLAMGLYKVVEGTGPATIKDKADPFLVSIPYPSVGGTPTAPTTSWLWSVHVYPKNTIEGDGEKEIGPPSANGLGSTVPWTITTRPLGSFNDGEPLTSYSVKDTLDPRLTYAANSAVIKVTVPGNSAVAVPGGNYSLTPPTGAGGQLVVDFDVDYVNGLPAGTTFEIAFNTTVTSVGNGTIENTGEEWINDEEEDFETNEVYTQWGSILRLKHETNNVSKVRAGAKFEVYNANTAGTCAPPLGAKVTVSGATEFTSNGAGQVSIPGLWVGNNGTPTSRTYCVVETAAPLGYVTDGTPIPITVTPGTVTAANYSAKVPNTPTEGPDLPLTGANGTTLMTVGGIALVALAGGAYLVNRRRASR